MSMEAERSVVWGCRRTEQTLVSCVSRFPEALIEEFPTLDFKGVGVAMLVAETLRESN